MTSDAEQRAAGLKGLTALTLVLALFLSFFFAPLPAVASAPAGFPSTRVACKEVGKSHTKRGGTGTTPTDDKKEEGSSKEVIEGPSECSPSVVAMGLLVVWAALVILAIVAFSLWLWTEGRRL